MINRDVFFFTAVRENAHDESLTFTIGYRKEPSVALPVLLYRSGALTRHGSPSGGLPYAASSFASRCGVHDDEWTETVFTHRQTASPPATA
jgi:hypothetical protein